jgi:hypothetical protein
MKNPKCEATIESVECDTEYPDYFRTEYLWAGRAKTKIECLSHAARSEASGRKVELIDQR